MLNWREIHSVLFVPAATKKLSHINDIESDAFIIDLEDAIKTDRKECAYLELLDWLEHKYDETIGKSLILRINKSNIKRESELFSHKKEIGCIAVPKVESVDDILNVRKGFPDKDIIALIETPVGLIHLGEILKDDTISAVGFGGEDFCVAMHMQKQREFLIPIKSQLILFARAYNKWVFDMIESEYDDESKYKEYVYESKRMGFDGKLTIHPRQVKQVNEVYKRIDRERAQKIISEYENNENGFVIIDGEIFEKPHIEALKMLLN